MITRFLPGSMMGLFPAQLPGAFERPRPKKKGASRRVPGGWKTGWDIEPSPRRAVPRPWYGEPSPYHRFIPDVHGSGM